jgi:hypothetical protein
MKHVKTESYENWRQSSSDPNSKRCRYVADKQVLAHVACLVD